MTPALVIEPLQNDDDFVAWVNLRNEFRPDDPFTVEEARGLTGAFPKDRFIQRVVMRSSDRTAIGRGFVFETPHSQQQHFVMDACAPAGAIRMLIDHLERIARAEGGQSISVSALSLHPWIFSALEAAGYEGVQTNPCLRLELEGWTPPDHAGTPEGVEIVSFADLVREDREGGLRRLWQLENAVMRDVPSPVPYEDMPFEDYVGYTKDPYFTFDTRFAAIADGELVGMTEFALRRADPTLAATYLTGVRAPWRRRGIARALKARALQGAQERGIRRVFADNEEANPMLALNLSLGFQKVYELRLYRKSLAPA